MRLDLERISAAVPQIAPVFRGTPQYECKQLGALLGCRITLKVEPLNPVRCFKGRGTETVLARLVCGDGPRSVIVYHQEGGLSHWFRLANNHDEPPENVTRNWFYPRLVGWNGYPNGLRDKLMNANLGAGKIQITNSRFNDALTRSMPRGIPFNPNA